MSYNDVSDEYLMLFLIGKTIFLEKISWIFIIPLVLILKGLLLFKREISNSFLLLFISKSPFEIIFP